MNAGRYLHAEFNRARRLFYADQGAITIVAIVFFVVLIGIGGLGIDLGRLYGVHGQMQAYVDNTSLAGAVELDGQSDSITRALRAIIGDGGGGPLVDGTQNFAEGDAALSIERVTFLSALGLDPGPTVPTPVAGDDVLCVPWDDGAAGTACTAEDSVAAQFVEVVATERQINFMILPVVDVMRGLVGQAPITDSATVTLRATAGFVRELCNNIPLMMCNPSEVAGGEDFVPMPGQQYLAKSQGAPIISPGNFGALAIIGSGANAFAQGIASPNPNQMCISESVPSEPGAMTGPFEAGMNVRMDIYQNGGQFSVANQASYPPALNVNKGLTQGPACGANQLASADPNSMPFPRHPCFGSDSPGNPARCADANLRVGDNADWDRETYWMTNYGVPLPAALAGATRYQVYQYEIANALDVNGAEQSAPMCGTPQPALDDRRVLLLAVVNCLGEGVPSGRADIPFDDIAKVFLTEPVGNINYEPWEDHTTNQDIYIEMIGKVEAGDASGVLHVFPILYR